MKTFFTIIIGLLVAIITLAVLFPQQVGFVVVVVYSIIYIILPIIFMAVKPQRFVVVGKWLWKKIFLPILLKTWWIIRVPFYSIGIICLFLYHGRKI